MWRTRCVHIVDILEETGLSDGPHSLAWASQAEDHPRSDKSGLSSDRHREALGRLVTSRRGFPKA